jgi:hypothetical protein
MASSRPKRLRGAQPLESVISRIEVITYNHEQEAMRREALTTELNSLGVSVVMRDPEFPPGPAGQLSFIDANKREGRVSVLFHRIEAPNRLRYVLVAVPHFC